MLGCQRPADATHVLADPHPHADHAHELLLRALPVCASRYSLLDLGLPVTGELSVLERPGALLSLVQRAMRGQACLQDLHACC